jgi:heme/copper-type cytochrome/quinol oxidase subunit 2
VRQERPAGHLEAGRLECTDDSRTCSGGVFLIAGIVGLMVFAAVLYVVIRFKDRGQPIPEQSHGNALIEYTFIAIRPRCWR